MVKSRTAALPQTLDDKIRAGTNTRNTPRLLDPQFLTISAKRLVVLEKRILDDYKSDLEAGNLTLPGGMDPDHEASIGVHCRLHSSVHTQRELSSPGLYFITMYPSKDVDSKDLRAAYSLTFNHKTIPPHIVKDYLTKALEFISVAHYIRGANENETAFLCDDAFVLEAREHDLSIIFLEGCELPFYNPNGKKRDVYGPVFCFGKGAITTATQVIGAYSGMLVDYVRMDARLRRIQAK